MTEKIQNQNAHGETHPRFLPGGTSWAKGVPLGESKNDDAHTVRITRGNLYDLHWEYARARKSGNPLLAPHGGLRSLKNGHQSDLWKFLREFGPLEWNWAGPWGGAGWREYAQQHRGEEPYAKINVADFWQKQLHFVLVAQLWEAWDDPARLHDALVNLALERERLGLATWTRFIPFLRIVAHLDTLPPHRSAMWDRPDPRAAEKGLDFEKFVAGVRNQNPGWLRHWAAMLIQAELDAESQGRRVIWGWRNGPGNRVSFEQKLEMNTLWAGIWELLALDFAQPLAWRICPHCGKLFYPPRKDRFYCTPEQQALASKRNWARTTRAALKAGVMGKGRRPR